MPDENFLQEILQEKSTTGSSHRLSSPAKTTNSSPGSSRRQVSSPAKTTNSSPRQEGHRQKAPETKPREAGRTEMNMKVLALRNQNKHASFCILYLFFFKFF